jgi:hypothetical protein
MKDSHQSWRNFTVPIATSNETESIFYRLQGERLGIQASAERKNPVSGARTHGFPRCIAFI